MIILNLNIHLSCLTLPNHLPEYITWTHIWVSISHIYILNHFVGWSYLRVHILILYANLSAAYSDQLCQLSGHQKRTCTWNMEHGEEHVGTCSFYMMSMYYEHVEHTEGTCWTCQRNRPNIPKEHVEHTKGTCRTYQRNMPNIPKEHVEHVTGTCRACNWPYIIEPLYL